MSVIYPLKSFEKTIGSPIAIKRGLVFESGKVVEEYVQGILRKVDTEKDIIEIEQYHTFLDFLNGVKNIPSKVSEFKNGEFEMVSNLVG